MKYAQIRKYDVANGPGIRTTFFVTGCTHNCYNCFNKKYQDFDFGKEWTDEQTKEVIRHLQASEVSGLTILGGEPFQNEVALYDIVSEMKKHTDKSIWIYSGYTFEQLNKFEDKFKLLTLVDVLIDGLFIERLKDLRLKFRGSSNQRIIDVKKSLENNEVALLEGIVDNIQVTG